MNLWPFTRHEQPQPLRAIVATRAESMLVQRKKADRTLELYVFKATTTKAERKAQADEFFARAELSRGKQIAGQRNA